MKRVVEVLGWLTAVAILAFASHAVFAATDHFAVSVLAEDQKPVSGVFASRSPDKFAQVAWRARATGAPVIDGASAAFDCSTHQVVDAGVRHIDEALSSGGEPPLAMRHLTDALTAVKPSTLDWLHRVRSYIEFANQSERYDDVAAYLKSRDVRRRLS